ncbi:MAG: hypothetical protein WC054_10175 [Candidatus Nanopelagicales bacterium]
MNARSIPEPWAAAFRERGLVDKRTGEPSLNAFSRRFSTPSLETLRNTIHGLRTPSEPTLAAVAEALNIPLPTIREWAGRPAGEAAPYSPPPEADQMNTRQRKAVDELIRSMVAAPAAEVPASSKPGRRLKPVTRADDLVDEVHETGVPSPELINRAAAHKDDDKEDGK